MKTPRPKLFLAIFVLALVPLFGPAATMQQAPKRPIDVSDVIAWKAIGSTVLSNDGQWFGYRSMPHGPMDLQVNTTHGGRIVYWSEPDGHVWEALTVSYARQPNGL